MSSPARPRPMPADSGQFAVAEALRHTADSLKEIQSDQREMRREVQDVRERMIRLEAKDTAAQIAEHREDIKELHIRTLALETDKQQREGASRALRFAKDYLPGTVMLISAVVIWVQAGGLG